eukprot:9498467-Pyramimonas_sp.AAC.1
MWQQSPGFAHRFVKGAPDRLGEMVSGSRVHATPDGIMGKRADDWASILSDPRMSPRKVATGLNYVLSRTANDDLGP